MKNKLILTNSDGIDLKRFVKSLNRKLLPFPPAAFRPFPVRAHLYFTFLLASLCVGKRNTESFSHLNYLRLMWSAILRCC